jgi:hypothetical protein
MLDDGPEPRAGPKPQRSGGQSYMHCEPHVLCIHRMETGMGWLCTMPHSGKQGRRNYGDLTREGGKTP